MELKVKDNCPLNKFKPCKKFECAWFVNVRGTHPQTGDQIDSWACSMTMLPMVMIENAQKTAQTGAAIESFRNEMVKANDNAQKLFVEATTQVQQLRLVEQTMEIQNDI